ncbi:hypothetical protein A2G06_06695 [Geobacter anodireducens]|nr:hypothetical protein A2G06_06695 [Geobacter anodireducens]
MEGRQMLKERGFSLVELIVVMAIFMVVIIISGNAFERILLHSGQLGKSAQSEIEGVIGLEIFRRDIEVAGFGLPWSFQDAPTAYEEVSVDPDEIIKDFDPATLNDIPPALPRAVVDATIPGANKIIDGSSDTNSGTDYLVIKSAALSAPPDAGRFSYVNYSGNELSNRSYLVDRNGPDDVKDGDRVISILSTFSAERGDNRQLLMNGASFFYTVNGSEPVHSAFKPSGEDERVDVYSIDSSSDLRMPYNRADYYVKKPATGVPPRCNPGTGVLFKSRVAQGAASGNTGYEHYALLDCVGDLQVVFELDTSGASHSGARSIRATLAGLSAQEIREQLRTVTVYILTHEGKKDPSFSYPVNDPSEVVVVSDPHVKSAGRIWKQADMLNAFGTDWRNYRWKVYAVSVTPRNLLQ